MSQYVIFAVPRAFGGGKIGPRRSLGRSLELLELLETSWSALGGLLEASWSALGALQGRKNKVGNGSWPALERQGDWFRIAWAPNNLPKGAQKVTQTELQRRLILKTWFLQKPMFFLSVFVDF